jgi:hypothetical protein
VTLTASVPRALVLQAAHQIRERLILTAPADVDVGEWGNLYDQERFGKLAKFVAEQELREQLGQRIRCDGIVSAADWFGAWDLVVADRAYDLIMSAGEGDQIARGQLDALRDAALNGDERAAEALDKFNAVALAVAAGLPQPSELHKQASIGAAMARPAPVRVTARSAAPSRSSAPSRAYAPARALPRQSSASLQAAAVKMAVPAVQRALASASPSRAAVAPQMLAKIQPARRAVSATSLPAIQRVRIEQAKQKADAAKAATPLTPAQQMAEWAAAQQAAQQQTMQQQQQAAWQAMMQQQGGGGGAPGGGGQAMSNEQFPDEGGDEQLPGDSDRLQISDDGMINDMAEYPEEVEQSFQEGDGNGEGGSGARDDGGPETFPDEGGTEGGGSAGQGGMFAGMPGAPAK